MSTSDTPAVARRRVSRALRQARQARKLTQGQVADEMGWSLSKVMRIEKGEVNVSPSDLKVLLDFLDVRDAAAVAQLQGTRDSPADSGTPSRRSTGIT